MREPTETTKENVRILERMVNSFSFAPNSVAQYFAQTAHRTLQQSLTRFCVEWLMVCASDGYGYDGRNEASHRVAKQLLDGKEIDGLPYI